MTASLDRPCVCGGRNPKCAKCGGWGFVSEEPRVETMSRGLFLTKVAKAKVINSCPICFRVVMGRDLDEHLERCHREEVLLIVRNSGQP